MILGEASWKSKSLIFIEPDVGHTRVQRSTKRGSAILPWRDCRRRRKNDLALDNANRIVIDEESSVTSCFTKV